MEVSFSNSKIFHGNDLSSKRQKSIQGNQRQYNICKLDVRITIYFLYTNKHANTLLMNRILAAIDSYLNILGRNSKIVQ